MIALPVYFQVLGINMQIYTDTNGQYPSNLSLSLRMLEITMECTPLDQIDFTRFSEIADDIDNADLSE
jgi:hypothetical protein